MDNNRLLQLIREKARVEQSLTLEVIELICQVERCRCYLTLGYSSLFEFVTKDLGYEPSSAMRRIQAARLLREIPEIRDKVENKTLSLSVISQAQSFFRRETETSGQKMTLQRKLLVLKQLENKSTRETEKELVKINPSFVKQTEKLRELTTDFKELKVVLDRETCQKLEKLKSHLAHQNPNLSYQGLLQLLINKTYNQVMKSKGMLKPAMAIHVAAQQSAPEVKTLVTPELERVVKLTGKTIVTPVKATSWLSTSINRPIKDNSKRKSTRKSIPQRLKILVWQRAQGQCQYVSQQTDLKCTSTYFLEIDHIRRVRHGGGNDLSNLQLLCRNHNRQKS